MIRKFIIPKTEEFHSSPDKHESSFKIGPLERGQSITIGNALRRTLIASVPGTSICAIQIKGVTNEFSTIDGCIEDVIAIILNLKKIIVSFTSENIFDDKTAILTLKGKKGKIKASDLDVPFGVKILNPNQYIVTDNKGAIDAKIYIKTGRGFYTAEGNKINKVITDDIHNLIITDSNYSPIKSVTFHSEITKVGKVDDYEKLVINIKTNGVSIIN